jgi:multiple sugar transport system ATP-binding protein
MANVQITNVGKFFGQTRVLNSVELDIAPGEFLSLVGPSGCGKTTLMWIIAGLETVSSGSVAIAEKDVTNVRPADRDVGMVFQNYAFYPHLTVADNLAVPLVMRRLSAVQRLPLLGKFVGDSASIRNAIADETRQTAEMLGIGHLMARKPAQLSGGQRQRVALGRAIVRHTKVFLMDEPLSNLDSALRVQMRTEIVALHRRVGASTVYVTHDQSEALTMSDRVAVMMDGDILQIATPEEIYANPQDIRVAAFTGSPMINTLAAEIAADGEVIVGATATGVGSLARGPITLAARPEDLMISVVGIPCRIEQVEFLGDSLLLHARSISGGEILILRLSGADKQQLALGATIGIKSNPSKVMLFDDAGKRVAAQALSAVRVHGLCHDAKSG